MLTIWAILMAFFVPKSRESTHQAGWSHPSPGDGRINRVTSWPTRGGNSREFFFSMSCDFNTPETSRRLRWFDPVKKAQFLHFNRICHSKPAIFHRKAPPCRHEALASDLWNPRLNWFTSAWIDGKSKTWRRRISGLSQFFVSRFHGFFWVVVNSINRYK